MLKNSQKKAVTFHYDVIFYEKIRTSPAAARQLQATTEVEAIDKYENLLIDLVCANELAEVGDLILTKNIWGSTLDQISITSEHYKLDTDPSLDPETKLEYTLLDMTIIYGYMELAKLLSDYGARAISPFINADDTFAEFIAELTAHQESRTTAGSRPLSNP